MGSRPGVARGIAWGDIRLVQFERPDKTRPCVILTRTSAIPYLNALTVAPVSRTLRGAPTEIALGVDVGLKTESAANLHAVQTVRKERVGRFIGSLDPSRKAEIRRALLFALELD